MTPDVTPALRHCPRCDQDKVIGAFGVRRRRGKVSLLSYCKACHVQYHAEWRNGKGKERFTAANAATKARYPERRKARNTLSAAVMSGRIAAKPCCIGGEKCGPTEAHHDDYTKPLEVRWVCRKHHRQLDRQRRKQEAA